MSAVPAPAAVATGGAHVFAGARVETDAARIAAMIDPVFLAEVGWDASRLVLVPPPEHPLLGRPVCRAAGCATTALTASRICGSCRRRLAEQGLAVEELASLPARPCPRSGRGPDRCRVPGCAREWASARAGLGPTHAEQQRSLQCRGVPR